MNTILIYLILIFSTNTLSSAHEVKMHTAFQYFLDEVKEDATFTHDEQHDKIQEFKAYINTLSEKEASCLTSLLIEETRSRIKAMLQNALLDSTEIARYLNGYSEAISRVENMNVEIARQMLFFVAELKIHRQYVYEFGVLLGCPEKQLLNHDLCKLDVEQFEGYARYFRGGHLEEDKPRYLASWAHHQYEEHHYQSYRKEGFNFDTISNERLRNNMLETVADWLAATKQRGGTTLLHYLVDIFPKQNPHPRLLPFLEEALKKAHSLYESEHPLFEGLPCLNDDVEKVFKQLKVADQD